MFGKRLRGMNLTYFGNECVKMYLYLTHANLKGKYKVDACGITQTQKELHLHIGVSLDIW